MFHGVLQLQPQPIADMSHRRRLCSCCFSCFIQIAAGNGEQVISRDVNRLGARMNIWRLLSWYHTGNGFFINTALIMFSLLVNAWLLLLIGVSNVASSAEMRDHLAYLGLVQVFQLSSLSLLVYVLTVWCEHGILAAITNVARQTLAGSMLFYVFRSKTSAFSFSNDLKFGGAQYAATGRGYKLKATSFVILFQQYARSHAWFGGHLLLLLVIALVIGVPVSAWALWSSWLVVLALLVAPFWFNPFSFDWSNNKDQAMVWWEWMWERRRAVGPKSQLWYEWNDDQLAKLVDKDGKQLGRFWSTVWGLFWNLPVAVLISYAIVGMFGYERWYAGVGLVAATNAVAIVLLHVSRMVSQLSLVKKASSKARILGLVMKLVLVGGAVGLVVVIASGTYPKLLGITAKLILVEFELVRFFSTTLLALFPHQPRIRRSVNIFAWVADMALGLLMLLMLFFGSLFGILTKYQATVLFSAGYAAAYLMEKALKGTEVDRITQEIKVLQKNSRQATVADRDYLDREDSTESRDQHRRRSRGMTPAYIYGRSLSHGSSDGQLSREVSYGFAAANSRTPPAAAVAAVGSAGSDLRVVPEYDVIGAIASDESEKLQSIRRGTADPLPIPNSAGGHTWQNEPTQATWGDAGRGGQAVIGSSGAQDAAATGTAGAGEQISQASWAGRPPGDGSLRRRIPSSGSQERDQTS